MQFLIISSILAYEERFVRLLYFSCVVFGRAETVPGATALQKQLW